MEFPAFYSSAHSENDRERGKSFWSDLFPSVSTNPTLHRSLVARPGSGVLIKNILFILDEHQANQGLLPAPAAFPRISWHGFSRPFPRHRGQLGSIFLPPSRAGWARLVPGGCTSTADIQGILWLAVDGSATPQPPAFRPCFGIFIPTH